DRPAFNGRQQSFDAAAGHRIRGKSERSDRSDGTRRSRSGNACKTSGRDGGRDTAGVLGWRYRFDPGVAYGVTAAGFVVRGKKQGRRKNIDGGTYNDKSAKSAGYDRCVSLFVTECFDRVEFCGTQCGI